MSWIFYEPFNRLRGLKLLKGNNWSITGNFLFVLRKVQSKEIVYPSPHLWFNLTMSKTQKLVTMFYRTRSSYYRWNRLLFPSAAELRLIEIMGGKYKVFPRIKHWQTKRPFVITFSLGKILQDEKFNREVRVGKIWIDFGNDVGMGIEVDGAEFHRDVVREFEREIYLGTRGWRIVHIPAIKLWNNPLAVQQQILSFIYD